MIPPLWVRLAMNLLLVLKVTGAAVALYKQNKPAIRRTLGHLRRRSKEIIIRRYKRGI